MDIEVTKDLEIKAKGYILNTPTMNGIYDKDNEPGKYIPGKDFSLNDNVSKGNMASYFIDIQLKSLSNSIYNLDKLIICSNDYSDDYTKVKIYYINTSPDAMNIEDNIENKFTGIDTHLYPVILKNCINSNSSFTTSLLFKIPYRSFWKSKIKPNIKIIAEKNNIQKNLNISLPEIKIAPKSNYVSKIYKSENNNSIIYNKIKKSFEIPFSISSYIYNIDKIVSLNNKPDLSDVTYNLKIEIFINNKKYKLDKNKFLFECQNGFEIKDYSIKYDYLTINMHGPFEKTNANSNIEINCILPFDININEKDINIKTNIMWNDIEPIKVNFNNNYHILYDISTKGSISDNYSYNI